MTAAAGSLGVAGAGGRAQPIEMSSSGPPPINHGLTIGGAGEAIVGGSYSATVSATGGAVIQSVSWKIGDAELGQSYTNAKGVTTDFGTQPHPANGVFNPAKSGDSAGFYWDGISGSHPVEADVTFIDGFTATAILDVSISAPTVNSFSMTYTPLTWATKDVNGVTKVGPYMYDGAGTAGFTVSGSGSIPGYAVPGEFGIIQKVWRTQTITNSVTGPHTMDYGKLVLDNDPDQTGPDDAGYLAAESGMVAPGGTGTVTFVDVPTFWNKQGVDPVSGNFDTAVKNTLTRFTVEDHLVFRPENGIWVSLSTISGPNISGEKTWNDKTSTWDTTAPFSPATGGTINGNSDTNFVAWDDYSSNLMNWDVPYPY